MADLAPSSSYTPKGEQKDDISSNYAKRSSLSDLKRANNGKLTVAVCEAHIVHLEDNLTNIEKHLWVSRKKNKQMHDFNHQTQDELSSLRTEHAVLQEKFNSNLSEMSGMKKSRRIIDIFIGIGCMTFGFIFSLHPIIEKGADKNTAILADVLIIALALCSIFAPSIILKEKINE